MLDGSRNSTRLQRSDENWAWTYFHCFCAADSQLILFQLFLRHRRSQLSGGEGSKSTHSSVGTMHPRMLRAEDCHYTVGDAVKLTVARVMSLLAEHRNIAGVSTAKQVADHELMSYAT